MMSSDTSSDEDSPNLLEKEAEDVVQNLLPTIYRWHPVFYGIRKVSSLKLLAGGAYWMKRKADLRAKRESNRAKRQIVAVPTSSTTSESLEQTSEVSDTTGDLQLPSRISVEWSGVTGGPPAEVVLRLHPASPSPRLNGTVAGINSSGVVVRAEEALIVAFVLLLWVAAIALFFNRWGKIRMLEPYQPKFQQQHRPSCNLAEGSISVPPLHRASVTRGCMSYEYNNAFPAYQPCGYLSSHRLRQNSVFVGSMGGMALIPESPPRRSRSTADLPTLVPPGSDYPNITPRSSRAASLHSAVDLRVCAPSPRTSRAASLHSAMDVSHGVQVHVRGSMSNVQRPRSPGPRRLTITNV